MNNDDRCPRHSFRTVRICMLVAIHSRRDDSIDTHETTMTAPRRSVNFARIAILDGDRSTIDPKISSVRYKSAGGGRMRDRKSRIEITRQYSCTPDTLQESAMKTKYNKTRHDQLPTRIPERRSDHRTDTDPKQVRKDDHSGFPSLSCTSPS